MRSVLLPLIVLISLAAIAIAQRAYHLPRLPDRVAAHIGPSIPYAARNEAFKKGFVLTRRVSLEVAN